MNYTDRTTDQLLGLVQARAFAEYDGHWTLLSFTTHFKAVWGTPCFEGGPGGDREDVWKIVGAPTVREALISLLLRSAPVSA